MWCGGSYYCEERFCNLTSLVLLTLFFQRQKSPMCCLEGECSVHPFMGGFILLTFSSLILTQPDPCRWHTADVRIVAVSRLRIPDLSSGRWGLNAINSMATSTTTSGSPHICLICQLCLCFLLLDSILLAIFKRNYAFLVSQCNECWKECSIDAQSPWATIDRRIYSRILILGCTQIHLLCVHVLCATQGLCHI